MIGKKIIARKKLKRKPSGAAQDIYFTDLTQKFIQDYQQCTDNNIKSTIYSMHILPSFNKLVENLIFVYKFTSPTATFDELKSDCVTFLYESIRKWDTARGTKAFSYFNVVGKNWLIINCRQHRKRSFRSISLDDTESITVTQKQMIDSYETPETEENTSSTNEFKSKIFSMLEDMKNNLSTTEDVACLEAIIKVFESVDNLDLFNKRAIMVYVRDISGLERKHLSKSMSLIRKQYKILSGVGKKHELF